MKSVAGLYRLFWNTVRDKLRLELPYGRNTVKGGVKNGAYNVKAL